MKKKLNERNGKWVRLLVNNLVYNAYIYPKKIGRYTKLCIELNTNTKKRTNQKISEFIDESVKKY